MNPRQIKGARRLLAAGSIAILGCGRSHDAAHYVELQRLRSGAMDVVLLSSHERLRHPKDTFIIEFRSADGSLVDVGDVRASATMPMPGAPMLGSIEVNRSSSPGRYTAEGQFEMAGTWRVTIQWQGRSGQGAVAFSGSVQ
jgi:hypothetical protein